MVHVLTMNGIVLGVLGTLARAHLEAASIRACYTGVWKDVTADSWFLRGPFEIDLAITKHTVVD